MSTSLITSPFDQTTSALEVVEGIDLDGKIALVTGGASGIGLEIVRALASAGAEVFVGDIDQAAAALNLAQVRAHSPRARIYTHRLDLGDLSSISEFIRFVGAHRSRIDILINNAGVMAPPLGYTRSGHELQFGINYFGHYVLTTALLPALQASNGARVVSVSSIGHRRSDVHFDDIDYRKRPYERWEAYGQSKTCCALLAVALTETQREHGVTANAVNPGGSMTGLQRYLTQDELRQQGWIDEHGNVPGRWRTAAQCAATSVWAACGNELKGFGGFYLENCQQAASWSPATPMTGVKPYALSRDNALRLWELSAMMVNR